MKKFITLLAFVSIGFLSNSAQAQINLNVDASALNGPEVGAGYQINDNLGFGANYGYLKYANAVNFQFRAGLKHLYAYGTVNMISADSQGRNAIAGAVNQMIVDQENKDPNVKQGVGGFQVAPSEFKMTDLGVGGGVGIKFGVFFMEAGLRTTRITEIANQQVDGFINNLQTYVNNNPNVNPVERADANAQIESMRADVKSQLQSQFNQIPGSLKFLPEFRIGLKFTIGK